MRIDKCVLCGRTFKPSEWRVQVRKPIKPKGSRNRYVITGYRCDDGECKISENKTMKKDS